MNESTKNSAKFDELLKALKTNQTTLGILRALLVTEFEGMRRQQSTMMDEALAVLKDSNKQMCHAIQLLDPGIACEVAEDPPIVLEAYPGSLPKEKPP